MGVAREAFHPIIFLKIVVKVGYVIDPIVALGGCPALCDLLDGLAVVDTS